MHNNTYQKIQVPNTKDSWVVKTHPHQAQNR